jgi:hypothetical protein
MDIDVFDKSEIRQDLHRIESILSTDIFEEHNCNHPLVLSAFIELIICLDDLMSKSKYYCREIDFTDDVLNTTELQKSKKKKVTDITSLINFVRHAVCHINEANRVHGGVELNGKVKRRKGAGVFFNRTFGKGGLFTEMQSVYDDDQSFAFGEHLIYLKRHIIRAYNEAKGELLAKYPMIDPSQAFADTEFQYRLSKPKFFEKVYSVKVLVEDNVYNRGIDEFDKIHKNKFSK